MSPRVNYSVTAALALERKGEGRREKVRGREGRRKEGQPDWDGTGAFLLSTPLWKSHTVSRIAHTGTRKDKCVCWRWRPSEALSRKNRQPPRGEKDGTDFSIVDCLSGRREMAGLCRQEERWKGEEEERKVAGDWEIIMFITVYVCQFRPCHLLGLNISSIKGILCTSRGGQDGA